MNLSSILPNPQLSVVDPGGSYNGSPYPATITINGVTGSSPSLEGVPVTLDYQVVNAVGTITADLGTQPPELVGSYQVTASFPGSKDYSAATTSPYPFKITRATPDLTVTDLGGTYTGSAYAASAQVNGVTTTSLEGKPVTFDYHVLNASGNPITDLGAQAPVQAGSYSVQADFAGSADYYTATSNLVDFTINPAAPVVSVTDTGGPYTGSSYPASIQINGVSATSLEGVPVTLDYQLLSAVGISPYDLGTQAPVQAGTYSVTASFAGSVDYSAQTTAPYDFTISRIAPGFNVTDGGGVYTGEAYPGSTTINGVATDTLEGVPVSFTYYQGTTLLSAAPSDAGSYSVIASFGGSVDYSPTTTSEAPFTILQATPSVNVTSPDVTYDNLPYQEASATVTGVDGVPLDTLQGVPVSFTYYLGTTLFSAAPTDAGMYSVVASFAGSPDYAQATATSTFQITQAKPGISMTSGDVTFDNLPYQATATVTGVDGVALDTLEGVPLSFAYYQGTTLLATAPTDAGSYSAIASFGGSVDYSPTTTAEVPFSILQATPSVSVTAGDVTYDNLPYQATATVTGVDGVALNTLEGVSVSLTYYQGTTLLSTAPTDAGTYSVTASFAGSPDYAQAAATTTFQILQATPRVSVTSPNVTYDNLPYQEATATVTGVDGLALDTLEGVPISFTYYQGTTLLSTAPTDAGTYSVVASFGGRPDYVSANATSTFTITRAIPSVNVTSPAVTFDNLPYQEASATVTGVDGVVRDTLEGVPVSFTYYQGTTLLFTAPTDAGSYSVCALYPGSQDYTAAAATVAFTISQEPTQITVMDQGGTFNGSAFPATAVVIPIPVVANPISVTSSPSLSRTDAISPSNNRQSVGLNPTDVLAATLDYQQLNADGSYTDLGNAAPIHPGIYQAIGSFGGNQNYSSATTSISFVIDQAVPTVAVTVHQPTAKNAPGQVQVTLHGVVPGVDTTPSTRLEGVSPVLTFYASATAGASPLASAPSQVGNYTVVIDYPGSQDYQPLTAEDFFRINPIVALGSVASGSIPNPTGTTSTNHLIVEPLLAIPTNGPVITNLLFGTGTTTQVQQSVQAIVLVVITLPVNGYAVGVANEFAGVDPNAFLVVNEEDPEIDVQLAGQKANGLIVPPLLTAQLLPGPGADEKEPSRDGGEALGFLQRSTPRFNRKALHVTDSVFDGDDTVTLIEALTRGESVEPLAAPPDQPAPVADASRTEAEVVGSEEGSAPANGNRTLVVTLIVVVGAGLMLGAIVKLRMRWVRKSRSGFPA